jgi:hypothetical protein
MEFSRNQLFSSTGLAQDQDGRIRRGHHLDLFDDLPPRSALTNNFAKCSNGFPVSVEARRGHNRGLIRPRAFRVSEDHFVLAFPGAIALHGKVSFRPL